MGIVFDHEVEAGFFVGEAWYSIGELGGCVQPVYSLVKYDVSFWFGWQDQSDKKAKIQIIKSHQFRESPLSPNIPRISGVWFVIVFYVYDNTSSFNQKGDV